MPPGHWTNCGCAACARRRALAEMRRLARSLLFWAAALLLLAGILWLTGCAAGQAAPTIALPGNVPHVPHAPPTATRPAPPVLDVQQLAGQVVAAAKADLAATLTATVQAAMQNQWQATGAGRDLAAYKSEFGFGPVLIVGATLVLNLLLSHWREVLRIRQARPPRA